MSVCSVNPFLTRVCGGGEILPNDILGTKVINELRKKGFVCKKVRFSYGLTPLNTETTVTNPSGTQVNGFIPALNPEGYEVGYPRFNAKCGTVHPCPGVNDEICGKILS